MEKAFEIQKQIRDNAKSYQTYLTDLQNWEAEMKRKEAALNGAFEQDLPPVRSKIKKEKPVQVQKKPEKKISAFDYQSWDKFDVDKACEEVDMAEVGPTSLDSKKSMSAKLEKLREEAQYEKERGNVFVRHEKWDEAIKCYNRAIELVKDDAIYYANRGLCHLKKDSLHQAESDCTEALRLDPTYVKALQRRATARERLGSLRAASQDLTEVLKLEPHNAAARKQLDAIKARMGTKGLKSKSSPSSTPVMSPVMASTTSHPKIVEIEESKPEEKKPEPVKRPSPEENWRNGVGENVTVIKTVKKPVHLRSKRPLKPILVQEIPLGKTSPEKPPTRLKIVEVEDDKSHGDTNNNDSKKIIETLIDTNIKELENLKEKIIPESDKLQNLKENIIPESDKLQNLKENIIPESDKLQCETRVSEKVVVKNLVPPANSVQFMSEWKYLKDRGDARSDYLSIIEPAKIPTIFENALESEVLSEVLQILHNHTPKFENKVSAYLKALAGVKRFSALAMFLSSNDKQILTSLLIHCKTSEKCTEEEIEELKTKYEL